MDLVGRTLTGVVAIGFFIAGVFGILDYFIVKFLLLATFISVVVYVFYRLYKNENHPES